MGMFGLLGVMIALVFGHGDHAATKAHQAVQQANHRTQQVQLDLRELQTDVRWIREHLENGYRSQGGDL